MIQHGFLNIYIVFFITIFGNPDSFGQKNQNDSIIIKHLRATKITDSIHSPIPDSIRKITIAFLIKHGKDPFLFYTYDPFLFSLYKENHVIFYYKIGALREIYDLEQSERVLIGSPGETGDAIFITYDSLFKQAVQIFGDE